MSSSARLAATKNSPTAKDRAQHGEPDSPAPPDSTPFPSTAASATLVSAVYNAAAALVTLDLITAHSSPSLDSSTRLAVQRLRRLYGRAPNRSLGGDADECIQRVRIMGKQNKS